MGGLSRKNRVCDKVGQRCCSPHESDVYSFYVQVATLHTQVPLWIAVDKNAAYPVAMETLKADEPLAAETELRHSKYLNNAKTESYLSLKGY